MNSRIKYIDSLRWMTVSLLILYHAAMAYNTWGEPNYIFFGAEKPAAAAVSFISLWFMPLMFLLAGVSARFSLQKRGYGAFIRERLLRLGIPFLFGIAVIAPILSYVGDVWHNGYTGGYFGHFGVFFSRFTDLTGYDGGFTLGHFWFLGVLMLISLTACGVIAAGERLPEKKRDRARIVGGIVLAAGAVAAFDWRPFGKQIATYLCVYLLGYYFFSDEGFTARLEKHRRIFGALFLLSSAGNVILFVFAGKYETLNTVCNYGAFAAGIPAIIGFGRRYLDFSGSFSRFAAGISYLFYIVHFPLTVLCQYFLWLAGVGGAVNFLLTLLISYPLTLGLCCVIRKTPYVRILFGMKK